MARFQQYFPVQFYFVNSIMIMIIIIILGSLALDGSFPRDGVSIKTLIVVTPHHHKSHMSENVIE